MGCDQDRVCDLKRGVGTARVPTAAVCAITFAFKDGRIECIEDLCLCAGVLCVFRMHIPPFVAADRSNIHESGLHIQVLTLIPTLNSFPESHCEMFLKCRIVKKRLQVCTTLNE